MSDELDAIRKTLQAHTDELQKRSGIDAAVLLVLSVIARDLNLTANPDKTIEKLKTSFLFSRLQDQEIDAAIKALSEEREHLVFILWGNYAKAKGAHMDRSKHLVIESAHPSPFSAAAGFFGSKPFSKANEYLAVHNETPIDWL